MELLRRDKETYGPTYACQYVLAQRATDKLKAKYRRLNDADLPKESWSIKNEERLNDLDHAEKQWVLAVNRGIDANDGL